MLWILNQVLLLLAVLLVQIDSTNFFLMIHSIFLLSFATGLAPQSPAVFSFRYSFWENKSLTCERAVIWLAYRYVPQCSLFIEALSAFHCIHAARPSRASFYDDGGHLTTHGNIWTRESPNFLTRTLLFWSYGLSTSCRDISFFAQRCFPSLIIIK